MSSSQCIQCTQSVYPVTLPLKSLFFGSFLLQISLGALIRRHDFNCPYQQRRGTSVSSGHIYLLYFRLVFPTTFWVYVYVHHRCLVPCGSQQNLGSLDRLLSLSHHTSRKCHQSRNPRIIWELYFSLCITPLSNLPNSISLLPLPWLGTRDLLPR